MARLTMRQFCRLVREALDDLPPRFAPYFENVVVDVELTPSRRRLEELGDEADAHEILGVFEGRSLLEQEFGEKAPNRVILFKRNIEAVCRNEAQIAYEIRRTVLHELAHHLGFTEEDLEPFEGQPDPFEANDR